MLSVNYKVTYPSRANTTHIHRPCVCACSPHKRDHASTIKSLNNLFYECPHLTGQELQELVFHKRVQFNFVEGETDVELTIYPHVWTIPDQTWSELASILNIWRVGDQVRNKLPKDNISSMHTIRLIISEENFD